VLCTLSSVNSRRSLQSHAFWLLSNLVVIHGRTQTVLLPDTSICIAAGPCKQTVLMLWFDFFDCISSTSCCHRLHMLNYSETSDLFSRQLHPSLIVLKVPQPMFPLSCAPAQPLTSLCAVASMRSCNKNSDSVHPLVFPRSIIKNWKEHWPQLENLLICNGGKS